MEPFSPQGLFKALKSTVASCTPRIVVEFADTQDVVEGFMATEEAPLQPLSVTWQQVHRTLLALV